MKTFNYKRSIIDFSVNGTEKQFIFTGTLQEAFAMLNRLHPYCTVADAIEQTLDFPMVGGAHVTYSRQRMLGAYDIKSLRLYA